MPVHSAGRSSHTSRCPADAVELAEHPGRGPEILSSSDGCDSARREKGDDVFEKALSGIGCRGVRLPFGHDPVGKIGEEEIDGLREGRRHGLVEVEAWRTRVGLPPFR